MRGLVSPAGAAGCWNYWTRAGMTLCKTAGWLPLRTGRRRRRTCERRTGSGEDPIDGGGFGRRVLYAAARDQGWLTDCRERGASPRAFRSRLHFPSPPLWIQEKRATMV